METVRYEAKDIETIADLLKEGKVVAFLRIRFMVWLSFMKMKRP